jgi:hypothetical protein
MPLIKFTISIEQKEDSEDVSIHFKPSPQKILPKVRVSAIAGTKPTFGIEKM